MDPASGNGGMAVPPSAMTRRMGAAIEDGDKLAYLELEVVISPVGMARHAKQAHAATTNGGTCQRG